MRLGGLGLTLTLELTILVVQSLVPKGSDIVKANNYILLSNSQDKDRSFMEVVIENSDVDFGYSLFGPIGTDLFNDKLVRGTRPQE